MTKTSAQPERFNGAFYLLRLVRWSSLTGCLLIIALLALIGCQENRESKSKSSAAATRSTTKKSPQQWDDEVVKGQIDRFCGDCHGTPPPSGFAKSEWQEEVENGFRFYIESGRSDLDIPVLKDVVGYYRQHAPETVALPDPVPHNESFASRFMLDGVGRAPDKEEFTAHVEALELPGRPGISLVMTGLQNGGVAVCNPDGSDFAVIATLANPARFSQADVDGDGYQDLLVADLGSFEPLDHKLGKVVWLRWNESRQDYDEHVILDNIGRTADVQAGDFDGDGDADIVVAEFGWRKSGATWLLINEGKSESAKVPVQFDARKIDNRHGPINVPVVDLDQDGDLDFVLLLGQEHEAVVFFENRGDNQFKKQTLFSNSDPSFGSSGIELVDMDGDGDLDFLHANGDAFDRYVVQPFHGVRILENVGDLEFKPRELAFLPGAHRAMPFDFDNDDDLDIVAVANLPDNLRGSRLETHNSVVLFRNEGDLQFTAGAIQQGDSTHAVVVTGDFDHDGDSDFVTGNRSSSSGGSRLSVWWNSGETTGK